MSQENVEIGRGVQMALRPLSESESQRRTIDERLFVRLPALFRLLSERVIRLSPGSRIRRIMLTRLIRRAYAAMYRRDFDVLLPRLDPALEYRPRGGLFSVDVDTVIHGREGYRNLWETTLEAFDDLWIEAHEVVDFGDRFVITFHFRAHGSASGVPVSQRVFELVEMRRGLVARAEDFQDRSEALEAAARRE